MVQFYEARQAFGLRMGQEMECHRKFLLYLLEDYLM